MSENIRRGAMSAGGAVVVKKASAGGAVVVKKASVGGDIEKAGGGSPVVQASWGQITGNIQNQTDLAEALAGKADAADLNTLAVTVGTKADTAAVQELAGTVATKMTTPAGQEGQFMVYESGAWKGKTVAEWEGGNY